MPTTTTHKIYYPAGTAVPNIPVQSQTTAESVEGALNKITKAPFIICDKNDDQFTSGTAGTYTDVTWHTEIVKQGITHAAGSPIFTINEDGIYQVNVRVAAGAGSGTLTIMMNVNGVDLATTRCDQVGAAAAYAKPSGTFALKLTAGDVVKVRMKASVATLSIQENESQFQLSKIAIY